MKDEVTGIHLLWSDFKVKERNLLFDVGDKKELRRYPCAPWISTTSNPACAARQQYAVFKTK
jgi:hypothetical protein